MDGRSLVYSFGGLGTGKTYADITLRSFKYDLQADEWSEIPALPDTMGKIAAAASTVKGLVYIIGGYHVFADGHEKSSPKIHIFDPGADRYLADGANIPTPIDDQVQAVWRDSLIYVISGWSDNENVNRVQVYNPATNKWNYASPIPDEQSWKVFGSSGVIVGDMIYFAGGAGNRQEKNFPIQPFIRTGKINPERPLEIEWSLQEAELANLYRPGAVIIEDKGHWIGGAKHSYNYNGIAYLGMPVTPIPDTYVFQDGQFLQSDIPAPGIMDLRGIVLFNDLLVIVGGMMANQQVSNQTLMLKLDQ